MLAVRLSAQIEREFGEKLPVSIFFSAPTVAQLAELIAEDWRPHWKYLAPVQPRGKRQPIYFVPPSAMTSLRFESLARCLGSDQPFYAFEPAGLDGSTPHGTVQEMASAYIRELREFQPEGPYLLGGMCFGGFVAYEMAQQLTQDNELVSVLAMIDTPAPFSGPSWQRDKQKSKSRGYWSKMKYYIGRLVHHTLKGGLTKLISRFVPMPYDRQLFYTQRTLDANFNASRNYVASSYGDKIVVFQSEQYAHKANRRRWNMLAEGELIYHCYEGTMHLELISDLEWMARIADDLAVHL